MTDNCYWEKEYGTFEICAVEALPDLTVGWVQFDTLPDAIAGRSHYTNYPGASIAPVMARPAFGNGLIVMGATYWYGVQPRAIDGSHVTSGVFVSDDDGFTYSDLIEKYLWLPGGGAKVGYDGNSDYGGVTEHWGSDIHFDGINFYVVESTMNDASDQFPIVRTAKSADGLIWTDEKSAGGNYLTTQAAAYQGDVWFFGTNQPQSEYAPFDTGSAVVGHSSDDGANWATVVLGYSGGYGAEPWPNYDDCDANVDGLHIAMQEGWINWEILYFRPTSKTTWATPVVLFDFNTENFNPDVGPALVASKVNPLNVYIAQEGYSNPDDWVGFRRSTDGGASWDSVIPALQFVLGEGFYTSLGWGCMDMVELDDGRLVIVVVYYADDPQGDVGYVVSEDAGVTWDSLVVISTNEWVSDANSRNPRILACARGVDVVVTQTSRVDFAKAFIFRP